MSSLPKTHVSLEQYFAMADASDVKLEYYRGEVYAMSGALEPHNLITVNATIDLGSQLRGRPCRLYHADQLVRTADGLYTYPDLVVACGSVFAEQSRRTLLNPVLIVEILSKSTEIYDRTSKFDSYKTIDSLQEYLLISSDRMRVELHRRIDDKWIDQTIATVPDEIIELASCDCRLKIADLYEKVDLPATPLRPTLDE
jgi:Uma2 family endonuclease